VEHPTSALVPAAVTPHFVSRCRRRAVPKAAKLQLQPLPESTPLGQRAIGVRTVDVQRARIFGGTNVKPAVGPANLLHDRNHG
jgi:hypothetical protein